MTVSIVGVDRSIGTGRRLRVDSLQLSAGETTVVFGPNGSGKTTLARILAGTLPGGPGEDVAYLPQRPHLFRGSARRTLLLGLDVGRHPEAEALAERLGVTPILDQGVATLSGGERRRVALARALAGTETIVVLDEPFAEIGVAEMQTVRGVVRDALQGRTALLVTHDRTDAAAVGDRIVVLVDGSIRQEGAVSEVFALPGDETVAAVLGTANLLVGIHQEGSDGLVALETPEGMVWGAGQGRPGTPGVALFGAEVVTVHAGDELALGSARNRWAGSVVSIRDIGLLVEIEVDVGGGRPIVAVLTPGSVDALGIDSGARVTLAVKAASVRIVRR